MEDSPALSMLWEPVDPPRRTEKRFGFPTTVAAATWVTETVATSWGITVKHCDRLVISAWNAMAWITAGERRLIAKWSALPHLFAHLNDAALVAAWLAARGIPTAVPIRALAGGRLVEVSNERPGLGSGPALPVSRLWPVCFRCSTASFSTLGTTRRSSTRA